MRSFWAIALVVFLSGCTALLVNKMDQQYGERNPHRYDHPTTNGDIQYWDQVRPLMEKRCVVCHACYDSPCQLKLGSYQGLFRGANPKKIYDADRLVAAPPSRLFEDAQLTSEWRDKGFFSVLNEREDNPQANLEASVFVKMLELKNNHPLPEQKQLPDSFDLKLNRDQQCPTIEKFDDYAKKYPLWGMPYGLPGLKPDESALLMSWVEEGAPVQPLPPMSDQLLALIDQWEAFLNQDELKAQLVSRYLFEHLFLAHIYFDEGGVLAYQDQPAFFKLVRSKTPPGEPVELIPTRRPFSDPKTKRVYYRLIRVQESIVSKTHLPYRLNSERMARLQQLFFDVDYEVTELPGFNPKVASNPFVTFRQIPASSRYRFMLDEAQYIIMAFIKGPVCRGQQALNVINDYFWVTFVDPDLPSVDYDADFMANALADISLPAESASNASLWRWLKYADSERRYLERKAAYLNERAGSQLPLDLSLLWDGDGSNQNAALTIFRHFDSASVIKGLYGERPQTAWLITYPLLERIYYLLVAGYDVYGNIGHQLSSRIYMDFLRMEGEFHFLSLLPKSERPKIQQQWYRGSVSRVSDYIMEVGNKFDGESEIVYQTDDPLEELFGKLKSHLEPVINHQYENYASIDNPIIEKQLLEINEVSGTPASILPQTLFVALKSTQQTKYFTILHHNAYTNISHMFGNANRRLPNEDGLGLLTGLVGAYPSILLQVDDQELSDFVGQLKSIRNEQDYEKWLDHFAVRRTDSHFWEYSDELNRNAKKQDPIRYGLFDFNRLENR